jgi:CheY-like chemotaxis protein
MKTVKVLIVDDERDIEFLFRQKFRKELREGLVDFHFSFSGNEALEYVHSSDIENTILVLSDINMPGMNGLDLLKSLKFEFPTLRVVMVTAYGDSRNYEIAKDLGADGFITKPVDFELLRKEIFMETAAGV